MSFSDDARELRGNPMNLLFLGPVPLDRRIGQACDHGESFFDAWPDSPACLALKGVIKRVCEKM